MQKTRIVPSLKKVEESVEAAQLKQAILSETKSAAGWTKSFVAAGGKPGDKVSAPTK